MKVLSCSLQMIQEAGRYTCATAEYTGLLSYGMLKQGGRVIRCSVLKVTAPVGRGLMKPFVSLKGMKPWEGLRRIGRSRTGERAYLESRFNSMEEKLHRIEEKLAWIERYGTPVGTRTVVTGYPSREIDQAKHALLRQIVEANIQLRTAELEEEQEKNGS